MKKYCLSPVANKGFTLVELLITVLIVGIILSVAAPAFESMVSSNNAANAARRLSNSFGYARSEAVTRADTVRVCTSANGSFCTGNSDTQWAQGWLIYVDADGNGDFENGSADPVLRVENIAELLVGAEVTVTADGSDDNNFNDVCFNQLGEECVIAAGVTSMTFTFTANGESESFVLYRTGATSL